MVEMVEMVEMVQMVQMVQMVVVIKYASVRHQSHWLLQLIRCLIEAA